MLLTQLLNKRVLFVSGKGGVGKTTVSVALALLAARQKKKTLIVEMNSSGRVAPLFGAESAEHDEIALAPYVWGINLSPARCFEEYVLRQVRFKKIYDVFFNNYYVNNFIKAVPGLNEVLMLGKIQNLESQRKNRFAEKKEYDLIVVDAPATGHGLSVFEVPQVVLSAVGMGPLHHHAKHIQELLADEQKTFFCLVTLAEEMSVVESKDYVSALRERTELHFGFVFINAVMPFLDQLDVKNCESRETELVQQRAALNKMYVQQIEKEFADFERVVLPFQFQGLTRHGDFESLVKDLEKLCLTGPAAEVVPL